jgi:hypothetical protein
MLGLSTALLLQVILPWSLIFWQWRLQPKRWVDWGLKTILIGNYLLALTFADLWLFLPWYVGYVYLGIFILITFNSLVKYRLFRRIWGEYWGQGRLGWLRKAIFMSIILFLSHILWQVMLAYSLPDTSPVSLSFPLKNGTYYIANGGNQTLLNSHLAFLKNPRYRGNSYAVDILKLNSFGLRASKVIPTRLGDYNIFGEPVYAPCSGRVLKVENTLPDLQPPQHDRKHLGGNYVLLDCQSSTVLLAHLQRGTVRVESGTQVTAGQLLGKVGNSGNTGEPHLHIHAQRSGAPPGNYNAEPLPMLLDGQFLVRNQRVKQ